MVDRADAGGQEQPLRRVHGDRGVEDRGGRDDARVAEQLLHLGPFVRDAGDGAELAGRQRGRHGDLPHPRRLAGRRATCRRALAGRRRPSPRPSDAVGQAELHRLGGVGDGAAADGDDQVGAGLAGHCRGLDHRLARRVRRHAVEHRRAPGCPARRGPARSPAVSRLRVPLTIRSTRSAPARSASSATAWAAGRAEHDFVHPAEDDAAACGHGAFLPRGRQLGSKLRSEPGLALRPPSMRYCAPVMLPARSELRNSTTLAISSGVA